MEDLKEYKILLQEYKFEYQETSPWISIGDITTELIWQLHISLRNSPTIEILHKLLPVLKKRQWPFRIIESPMEQFKLNGGGYGYNEVGKVITLYPKSEDEIVEIINNLNPILEFARGPRVSGGIRLRDVIYITCIQKLVSISVPRKFRKSNQIPRSVGLKYIHKEILHATPKAHIFKSINLKNLDWCVVKQGHANMADDESGRDIGDRLRWEKTVLEYVSGFLPVPKVIDFFEKNGESYMVTEYIDGIPIGIKRKQICGEYTWELLSKDSKNKLLKYFQSILEIISVLHNRGYVHRDITDSNFLVGKNDEISIIDFEIAYDLNASHPDPAYVLGTYGFVSPEQMEYKTPTIQEDIYSLGALLLSLVTGGNPVLTKILPNTLDPRIAKLMRNCMAINPTQRPTIGDIKRIMEKVLADIKQPAYEKETSY